MLVEAPCDWRDAHAHTPRCKGTRHSGQHRAVYSVSNGRSRRLTMLDEFKVACACDGREPGLGLELAKNAVDVALDRADGDN